MGVGVVARHQEMKKNCVKRHENGPKNWDSLDEGPLRVYQMRILGTKLRRGGGLKGSSRSYILGPIFHGRGALSCLSDPTLGGLHLQVEGPFGIYPIQIFDLRLCDLDRCHIRFLGFQIGD